MCIIWSPADRWIALIHQLHVAGEEGGSATMVAVFLPVLPVGVVLWLSSCDVTRSSYVAVGTKKLKEGPARGLGMLLCVPHWRAPHLLNRWRNSNNHYPRPRANQQNQAQEAKPEEALVFAQKDSTTSSGTKSKKASGSTSSSSQSTTPKRITNVKCLLCGQLGHTSAVCPDAKPPARLPAQIHAMADIDDASVDHSHSA
jgi:hypothetical protein